MSRPLSTRLPRALAVVAGAALLLPIAAPASAGALTAPSTTSPPTPATIPTTLTGDIHYSVPSGTFEGELWVSLSTSFAYAQIRYTTDGSMPTASSPVYSGPLRLTTTTQLRAQAFVNGTPVGEPGTALYVARSGNPTHDLPVLVLDNYGQGAPGREYVDAAALLFEPVSGTTSFAARPTLASRVAMRLRGQSSATFPKTPYRLEFRDSRDEDADLPVLGMPADDDWVLRGPYPDKALIRDAFVYSLGRDLGLAAPRFAFVELYVNLDSGPLSADDYQGVYLIVETIKNTKNRLDLKKLRPHDITPPAIEGGYIFKFEWMAAEEPTLPCRGNPMTCWNFLEVVDPDPLQPEQKEWLNQHIQQFHDMLHSPGFADPQTGYPAWIDVQSFVDRLIIGELTREMDSYVRSAYFHKDRGGKITAGPLWDFDLSFGVGGFFNNTQIAGWQYEQVRFPLANDWYNQLMRDPAFVDRVRARWQELRQGLLSNAQLDARIAALAGPLTNAAQRNFARWPNLSEPWIGFFMTPTAPTWEGQVQAMRQWMFDRAAWLDSTAGWGGPVPRTN